MKNQKKRYGVFLPLICGLTGTLNAQNLYVVNGEGNVNSRIREYGLDGSLVNASLITVDGPCGIAISGTNLFVADFGNDTVDDYTTSGATVAAPLVPGSGFRCPNDIAVSGNDLFIADDCTGFVGEYTTSGAPVNPSLIDWDYPVAVAVSGTNLFVVNEGSSDVGEFTTSGATVTTGLIGGLDLPIGIAVSGTNLFVDNFGNGTVGKYTISGTVVNASLITGLDEPNGIAVLGNNLFVVNYGSGTVGEYTTSGTTVNASLISGLSSPSGIVIGVSSVPPSVPRFTGISVSGSTLNVTATNGPAGGTYTLLATTNMLLPLKQWVPVLTNTFSSGGNLRLSTNIVTLNTPAEFYILAIP